MSWGVQFIATSKKGAIEQIKANTAAGQTSGYSGIPPTLAAHLIMVVDSFHEASDPDAPDAQGKVGGKDWQGVGRVAIEVRAAGHFDSNGGNVNEHLARLVVLVR